MKNALVASATTLALLISGVAYAQSTTTITTKQDTTGSITIAPEKRTVIKKYITEHKVAPAKIKEKITIGEAVPHDVTLQPVPETIVADVPSVKGYEYFVYNDHIYFVNPQTRKVVTTIEE